MKHFFLFIIFFAGISFNLLLGQQQIAEIPGLLEYIEDRAEEWSLNIEDFSEMGISDDYISSHSGARHLYLVQQHKGIDVYNALKTVTFRPDGEILTAFTRFIPDMEEKIVGESPALEPEAAILNAFGNVGIEASLTDITPIASRSDELIFSSEKFSSTEIPVRLVYMPREDGTLELAWDLSFEPNDQIDYWSVRVSALTGEILDQISWTVKCNLSAIPQHRHDHRCFHSHSHSVRGGNEDGVAATQPFFGAKRLGMVNEQSAYRVVPFPFESPIHGDFELVENPYDEEFSPLGWHSVSTDGSTDFTHTRGNNTITFVDRVGNSSPDFLVDGGSGLTFDFPFDQDLEPEDYQEAAVTNLFYWNNILHDFSYAYGFDEASGNFQQVNLSGSGAGNDPVRAIAQSAANTGQSINNATFSTPPDGSPGTMRMFVWTSNSAAGSLLNVEEPLEISGQYETGTADFGAPITLDPIIGEAHLVNDGVGVVTDGCQPIQNIDEIAGNIAIIDRGICEFGVKVLNAEEAGAIAVIICNNRAGGIVNMAPGAVGGQVTIPSIFISQEDCNIIRQYAGEDLKVRLQLEDIPGPAEYDASFDNGIIAHEFAHGVSIRFTGGPSNSGCLVNANNGSRSDGQQMGEGWSDYFSLITGIREGDTKNTNRGVGNYVIRSGTDARGIRSYPYNYNMSANPVTFYDSYDASVPHGVGHVWGSMIWDLFWDMVDEHGFDPDFYRGTGGNNMAIQLVMDGMKLQPCNPGFVDGRDAILAADQLLYDGQNQCLIWNSFARRGLGWGAEQGNPFRVRDAKESYDVPPSCLPTVKIAKEMTPLIEAGDVIDIELRVNQHRSPLETNLEIRDRIPTGASVVVSSLPDGAVVDGDEIVISIDELEFDEEVIFNYQLNSDPTMISSLQLIEDNEEDAIFRWLQGSTVGSNPFTLIETNTFSGEKAWFVPNTATNNDQTLTYLTPLEIQGSFPVLRFAHNYDTEPGTDGGLIRVSNDGLESYIDLGYAMFRNEYPNRIAGNTFSQGNLDAFSGSSGGWKQTYVDMSDFLGDDLFLEFRFGSDDNNAAVGWYIDDLELFDAVNYQSEVKVLVDDEVVASAFASGRGTIVEPQLGVTTEEVSLTGPGLKLFPNPTNDRLNVLLEGMGNQSVEIVITDLRGKQLYSRAVNVSADKQMETIGVYDFPVGMYQLSIISGNILTSERFVRLD